MQIYIPVETYHLVHMGVTHSHYTPNRNASTTLVSFVHHYSIPIFLFLRIFDLLVSSVFVVLNEECGKSYNEYIVARAVYDIEALCAEVSAGMWI